MWRKLFNNICFYVNVDCSCLWYYYSFLHRMQCCQLWLFSTKQFSISKQFQLEYLLYILTNLKFQESNKFQISNFWNQGKLKIFAVWKWSYLKFGQIWESLVKSFDFYFGTNEILNLLDNTKSLKIDKIDILNLQIC